jgi:hypothetical protein
MSHDGSGNDAATDTKETPMPTVTLPNLTLSENNGIVTMTITFLPTFSNFEKELGSLGCTYDAHYSVHGVDNGLPGAELTSVDIPNMAIPVSRLLPVLPVIQQVTVARTLLQEDPAAGDADELKVKIRIHSHIPEVFTPDAFTDQEVLTSA